MSSMLQVPCESNPSKGDDIYTPMQSVGTLKKQLSEQSQEGSSTEAGGCMGMMYSNMSVINAGTGGGSAGVGGGALRMQGLPENGPDRTAGETEERYIMLVR